MATPPRRTSPKLKVVLVPWDPDSREHVGRLFAQRVACGWKSELVESKWTALQRTGEMAIVWVVLADDEPTKTALLTKHLTQHPSSTPPLSDTAPIFASHLRLAPPSLLPFHPIGHLSLDSTHLDPTLANPQQHIYCLSNLYISSALHGSGLGRAALDATEALAAGILFGARELRLDAICKEHFVAGDPIWAARGTEVPEFVPHTWYERLGYREYMRKVGWFERGADGVMLPVTVVCMKKALV